jgi:hypothetical protein
VVVCGGWGLLHGSAASWFYQTLGEPWQRFIEGFFLFRLQRIFRVARTLQLPKPTL